MSLHTSFVFKLYIVAIGLFLTCGNSPQPASVLFNDPMGNYMEKGRRIENAIVKAIDDANASVKIAMYNFDSQAMLNAMLRARRRGVDVRLVGDDEEAATPGYRALLENGLSLTTGNHNGIHHNKFVIIDQRYLITGTGNFSHSCFYRNDNHFIFLEDPHLVERYDFEFEQMRGGRFSRLKTTGLGPGETETGESRVYFTPQESHLALDEILMAIRHAKSSIHYMIFAFTSDEIAAELLRAHRRGVKIRGIHDIAFTNSPGAEAPNIFLAASDENGPEVYFDGNENTVWYNGAFHGAKLHTKTMIIDAEDEVPTVITGSFNWSANAIEANDENLLIFNNKEVAQSLMRQWKIVFENARPLNELIPPPAVSRANPHDVIISEVLPGGLYGATSHYANDDFIEIFNNTGKPIDLSLWVLSWKNGDRETFWRIPKETPPLAAGDFRVFYSSDGSGFFQNYPFPEILIRIPASKKFQVDSGGFSVGIYDAAMNMVDSVVITPAEIQKSVDRPNRISRSQNRRRTPSGALPSWYRSGQACAAVCGTLTILPAASPGFANEAPPPPQLLEITDAKPDGTIIIQSSGFSPGSPNVSDFIIKEASDPLSLPLPIGEVASSKGDFLEVTTATAYQNDPFVVYSVDYLGGEPLLFNSPNPGTEDARVRLNEVYIPASPEVPWIELVAESGGNLYGLELYASGGAGKYLVFRFPRWNIRTGEVLVVFYDQPETMLPGSAEKQALRSSPYFVYSPAARPDRGDGIIILEKGKKPIQSIFYTNQDGFMSDILIQEALIPAYSSPDFQSSLSSGYPFPVTGVNEADLQDHAVPLPAGSTGRSLSFKEGTWMESVPDPGIP